MNSKIPEEILRQWREEFENLYLGKWTEFDVCKRAAREAFIAAKTSSYELKENLRKEKIDIEKSLKNSHHSNNDLWSENKKLNNNLALTLNTSIAEIKKRDNLLKECLPWVESVVKFIQQAKVGNPKDAARLKSIQIKIEKWLKQYEEMKR